MLERLGQHFARIRRERSAKEIARVEAYENRLRGLVAQLGEGNISHDEFTRSRKALVTPHLDFRRAAEKLGNP